jgi:hypothetical protein
MWTWPARLFALAVALWGGALFLGFTFDDGGMESGFAAAMTTIAGFLWVVAFLVVPAAVLTLVAALFRRFGAMNTPHGSGAPGPKGDWTWGHNLAVLAMTIWLFVMFFVWVGTSTGGGGLDGPCSGRWATERGGGLSGNCERDIETWPPLSQRVVIHSAEGHFERVYPSTVAWLLITSMTLFPLAAWPAARWLTAGGERSPRPPLRPLAWLAGGAVGLGLLYSVFVDEETSRPLNASELAAAERAELAAAARANRSVAERAAGVDEPPAIATTRVRGEDVSVVVASSAAVGGQGSTSCAAGDVTGLGLWTCATALRDGAVVSSQVTITADGSYAVTVTDRSGIERPFRGCCVTVTPG